ncbi:MAG TPA: (d)CMP kinase [Anaerolineaceae bacterium]|nr:(d)CMP kinase [Anaerolineaceae bacterium]HQH84480.1 (d)CMP kinase [Anaerolineaceae bacterium]
MNYPKTIAIDGPAASGKSTLGERLASRLGYLYFDTGVMYRAVTWAALRSLKTVDDEAAVTAIANQVQIDVSAPTKTDGRKADILLDGEDITWDIRRPEVDANVSQVSAYSGVRSAMTAQQRRIGLRGCVVMVGRDIGTVVLPEADVKIYLVASVEERARRRTDEVLARGERASYATILESMRRRDQIDSTRAVAPLRPADDAVILDSDGLDSDAVFARACEIVEQCATGDG